MKKGQIFPESTLYGNSYYKKGRVDHTLYFFAQSVYKFEISLITH
jgi:hypothetical protein